MLVKRMLSACAVLGLVTLALPVAAAEAQVAPIEGHIIGEGQGTGIFERER